MNALDAVMRLRDMEAEKIQRTNAGIRSALERMIQVQQNKKAFELQKQKFELDKKNTMSLIESRSEGGVWDKLKQVNVGIDFAKSTGNKNLFAQLSSIGNDLMNPEQAKQQEGSLLDKVTPQTQNTPIPQTSQNNLQGSQVLQRDPMTGELTIEGMRQKNALELEDFANKEKTKQGIEQKQAESMSNQSVNTVAGSARRLVETYVKGLKEGSMGDIGKKVKSDIAGKVGGNIGDKYPASAAYSGQKTEMITKMMPLLTQQGSKPGSVRLVSTVFDRLLGTMPGKQQGPIAAKEMMTTTVKNMYGFAKAVRDGRISNEMIDLVPDEQLSAIGDSIANDYFVNQKGDFNIKLSKEEQAELDTLIKSVVDPIDEYLKDNKEEEDFSKLSDEELRKIAGGE